MNRNLWKHLATAMMLVLLFLSVPLTAFSAVPRTINYQGYLTATDGTPVSRSVAMQISLYDVPTGGTLLWTEQQVVTVTNGQYSINLGEATALNLLFDKPYYLGVKIDADQEMTPRLLFTSLPYALRSATADAVADASVGTAAIANGAVTATKLGITCSAGQVLVRTTSGWGCGTVSTGGTGTITSIIAGNGLTSGGSSGSVQLDVNFAGTGAATTAARSDHNHDTVYQKKYGKVAIVAKSGGDYATPAAALTDSATWCGTPSAANPCQMKIMPGRYDMGTSSLSMLGYIDINGSGKSNTIISGTVDSLTAGVVNGASNVTLSNLTVQNSGGAGKQNAIAIFNNAVSPQIENVSASASGAVKNYALYNTGSGTVKVRNSVLDGSTNTVYNNGVTTQIFASTFLGGSAANNGTGILRCAASIDANNVLFERSCPPFNDLQVVAVQPSPIGQGYFPANGIVKAQFNNDMTAATITAATFKVLDGNSGSALPGTVSYDAATRSAIFTPSAPLTAMNMQAVVTTGVRDLSGGTLSSNYSWPFYGGMSDTTPLTALYASPTPGSTGLAANAPISISFNKQIDTIAVSSANMTVKNAANTPVTGTLTANSYGISFAPAIPLALGTTYIVTVSGVKDLAGNAMSAPYSYSFTMAPLPAPLGINATASSTQATVSWQPVSGATSYNLYWSTLPFGPSGGANPATVNKIANATSPYQHTVPATPPFSGNLQVSAAGTLPAGQKIAGVNFDLNLPPSVYGYGVNVTLADTTAGSMLSFNPTMSTVRVAILSASGFTTGPLVNVQVYGNPAGLTATDFTISNAQLIDSNGAPLTGLTLTTADGSTAGTTCYYAVTAAIVGGESPRSNTVSAYIDSKPPVVLSGTPAGTSVNQQSNDIRANFSEQIDMGTLTAATFVVSANGSPTTGSFGSGGSGTVYFYPASPLQQATTYTVSLTTGIKDLAGNPLQAPYSWNFTTTIPAPSNLTALRGYQQVTLNWQPVSGATSYNVYWSTSYGVSKLNGTKIGNISATTYTHSGLTSGMTYSYIVTAVVGTVESEQSNQQSVLIDSVPPAVTATTPANNATAVATSAQVCVSFSEQIDSGTWNSLNVSVKDGSGSVVNGMFGYYGPCMGPSFTPNAAFTSSSTYTVTISGVRDQAGNPLASPYTLSFTTAPTPPTNLVATAGALQTSLTWTAVSGATLYNIYWANSPNITQAGMKISGVTTNFYLHTNLANGSIYYYRVAAVTSGAESALSNEVGVNYDATPPAVSSTNPAAGPGAWQSSYISATFSENIDPATVTATTLTLKDGNGLTVSGNSSSWMGNNSVSFQTTNYVSLNYGTTYTASISGVKDLSGNMMAPYSWTFITQDLGVPGVNATAGVAGSNQITLSWFMVGGATTYNVYWSTTAGVTIANGTRIVGATPPFTHTGLNTGTTYYYVVTAVSGPTEGAASTQVSAVAP